MHGKSVSNVMEKSWNIMEFGFENCVGTLIHVNFQNISVKCIFEKA